MKRFHVVVILIVILAAAYFVYRSFSNGHNPSVSPQVSFTKTYTVADFKKAAHQAGVYQLVGFVVKKYDCPDCPDGAQCKPCMKDNIVISDSAKLIDDYNLSDNELILFTIKPNSFDLKTKYSFIVRVTDQNTTGESINDLELVSYQLTK